MQSMGMSLNIDLYEALTGANVPAEKARQVVQSLEQAIDDRYGVHAKVLVTQGDLKTTEAVLRTEIAGAKNDILRWVIGIQLTSTLAIIGTVIALIDKIAR